MKTSCIDIFNNHYLHVRNHFLTHNTDASYNKKHEINKLPYFAYFYYYYIPFSIHFYLYPGVSPYRANYEI